MPGQSVIQGLGKGMGLGQIHRQIGHGIGKQLLNRACDATKLLIALREVVFTIELIEKEPGGRGVTRIAQKIGVGGPKAPGLQLFDLVHRRRQAVNMGLLPKQVDAFQMQADALSWAVAGGCHHRNSLCPVCPPCLGERPYSACSRAREGVR